MGHFFEARFKNMNRAQKQLPLVWAIFLLEERFPERQVPCEKGGEGNRPTKQTGRNKQKLNRAKQQLEQHNHNKSNKT